MRVVACDNEDFFVDQLEQYCDKYQSETEIPIDYHKFNNGKDMLTYFDEHGDIDIFILDIKMPGINGAEIAETVRSRNSHCVIIFLTGIFDYALRGYEIGIDRYWMKPLSYKKFRDEMNVFYRKISGTRERYLIEHIGRVTEKMPFENILYIETKGRKTLVHNKSGDYESTTTMTEYEKKLDDSFYRCHAAYLVNLFSIIKINGMKIMLENGDIIYTSKKKRKGFLAAFHYALKNK